MYVLEFLDKNAYAVMGRNVTWQFNVFLRTNKLHCLAREAYVPDTGLRSMMIDYKYLNTTCIILTLHKVLALLSSVRIFTDFYRVSLSSYHPMLAYVTSRHLNV